MRSLETSLGVELFSRTSTGMTLGERGRLLLHEARRLLDLAVRSLMRQPMLRAVADGELDAGLLLDTGPVLGTLGFDGGDLSFVDIESVRLFLVARPGPVPDPLLVTPKGCSFRMAAERLLGTSRRRLEFDSVSTIRAWATQGLGVALLPDFVVSGDLAAGTLVALPKESGELAMRVAWRTDRDNDLRDVLYAMAA
ncbi:hypothetical protein GCM10027445_28580 [Amycolatopsis endophytica]